MPQQNIKPQQKKKIKGHAPAHQNAFAFYHNPKSKKTANIMEMPIQYVCRRCHEKLEWRKQYRKYKPLTQPRKCNICQQPHVVRAAYHTICEHCTRTSTKAIAMLEAWNQQQHHYPEEQQEEESPSLVANGARVESVGTDSADNATAVNELANAFDGMRTGVQGDDLPHTNDTVYPSEMNGQGVSELHNDDNQTVQTQLRRLHRRVCAMCVAAPALPDDENDDFDQDDDDGAGPLRKLRLRDVKRLERQSMKRKQTRTKSKPQGEGSADHIQDDCSDNDDVDEDGDADDSDLDGESDLREKVSAHACMDPINAILSSQIGDGDDHMPIYSNDDDDEKDPFLLAVGGADKLLTGEAYQQKLLSDLFCERSQV